MSLKHSAPTALLAVALSALFPAATLSQSPDVKKWLERHDVLDGWCRGDAEGKLTDKACNLREAVGAELERLNWCYGRNGEAGYQKRWHVCGPDSQRLTAQQEPPKVSAFYGVWGSATDQCRSFKARTEGPYFTIRDRRYVPQGGGTCRKLSFQLHGSTLTVRGECLAEEAGFGRINDRYSLVGSTLKSPTGETFQRCAP